MARPVFNPPLPSVRVKVSYLNYKATLALAQTVHTAMVAAAAFYTTPLPTMANFLIDITALQTAISSLGTKSNKGAHLNVTTVRAASLTVHNDLVLLAAYVTNVLRAFPIPAYQTQQLALSGFAAKKKKATVPLTQFVRNAKQVNNKKFPPAMAHVKWKKPLGLFTGKQLPSYDLYSVIAGVPVYLTTTTATSYTVNPSGMRTLGVPPNGVSQLMIVPKTSKGAGNGFIVNLV